MRAAYFGNAIRLSVESFQTVEVVGFKDVAYFETKSEFDEGCTGSCKP
jgi:hypothetical protein